MFDTVIMPILTLLVGGGLATFITIKATKRTANAHAEQAEVQARSEEFHLLKEQIELNQQQNLDLTKLNLELVEQNKEKEIRFAEQTELLRKAQANLLASEGSKLALTTSIGDLKVQLATKRCDDMTCPFRLPPNAYTPPRPNMTNEEYHTMATKKIKKTSKENKDKK